MKHNFLFTIGLIQRGKKKGKTLIHRGKKKWKTGALYALSEPHSFYITKLYEFLPNCEHTYLTQKEIGKKKKKKKKNDKAMDL